MYVPKREKSISSSRKSKRSIDVLVVVRRQHEYMIIERGRSSTSIVWGIKRYYTIEDDDTSVRDVERGFQKTTDSLRDFTKYRTIQRN
jgi:hypothetical protein